MAQLVHDVAPGAGIAFHTAFNSQFDFAEGIIELADAGADVIVDDVRYFEEPFFMDGMVAQAVDIVAARGVPYYSSAGNQARNSYENDFHGVNVVCIPARTRTGGKPVVRRFHSFGATPAVRRSCSPCSCSRMRGRVHDFQLPVGSAASDGDDLRTAEGGPEPIARGRRGERPRHRVLR